MSTAETSDVAPPDIPQPNKGVMVIHTMADVQSMDKPSHSKAVVLLLVLFVYCNSHCGSL